jgi:hypothetical protein
MLSVLPGPGTKLTFINGPLVLSTTQTCSAGQFTVQLQDQFDNPVTTATQLPLRLSVTGLSNVQLFDTASGCVTAAQTDFTIPPGSNSVSLRAAGMTASATPGEIRAAVLNGAAIADATQVLRISAGFASKFRLAGNAQSPVASVCSANSFLVELLDSADNPASSASPVTFVLTTLPTADATFHFYSGAGCQTDLGGNLTVPAGQTSAQFYFRGNKAVANFEIRGSASLTPPPTFLPGNSIRAAPPAKLVFGSPLAQTAQAGTCTAAPYAADVVDLFDNPTSFATPQIVTVGSNPAGVTVGTSTCATGNTVPLAAGATQVTFTAQHTVTTPVTPYALTATVNGFSTAIAATLNVTPGPSTLMVDIPLGGTSNIGAGACQQITLTRRDAFNNPAPTTGTVTLGFPAMSTWLVYATSNCMGTAGAPIVMTNTHTVTFSVSPHTSGMQQVSASIGAGATLQTAFVNFVVAPGTATLVFEVPNTGTGSAAAAANVGDCTPVTVARKDTFGNDVPVGSAQTLTFTLPGGTTVYSGASCATAIANLPLLATDARASFSVKATVSAPGGGPQAQIITATLMLQSANLTLTVSPGAPILGLVLPAGGMATVAASICQAVTVERRDSSNNLVPVPAARTLTIAPAGLTLFSATDCTGPSSPTIAVTALATGRAFGVSSTLASAPVVYTITLDGQTVPMTLTVNPGPTTQFVVQGLPPTGASAAPLGPITLRRRDAFSNDTSSGVISVAMSSSQFQFCTLSNCSDAAGSLMVGIADGSAVSTPFYAIASLAGLATMTATLGAATGTGSTTIGAGTPSQLFFLTGPRTFTAGICSGAPTVITVQLRDAAGNPANAGAGGQAFTATSSSAGGTWYTNATCAALTGGAFTIPVGTNSVALYYKDTLAGSPSISLTNLSGLANPAPQVQTVNVGAAAKLVFTSLTHSFTAAQCGALANAITVQLQDAPGNPVNAGVAGQAFTASSTSTGTVTWYTDDTCATLAPGGVFTIPNGSNSVSLVYKDTKVGTPSISLANGSGLTNPAAQAQTVVAGAPSKLVFTSAVQTIPALGCSPVAATVTLQDLGGNIVNTGSDRPIAFSATPAGANTTFYTEGTCTTPLPANTATMTNGTSTATMFFKADNATPTVTLTASSALLTSGTQTATIQAASPAKLVFTTAPTTVEAGFCLPVVVERQDALNRPTSPASATPVTLSALPAPGMLFFTNAACTTALVGTFNILSGQSNATVYVKGVSGSLAGAIPGNQIYTHTAASGVLTSGTLDITVEPMVRRRSVACTLATGTSTITCPITPLLTDITRTMLFFQATPNSGDSGANDNVTCRLNLNTNAEVICDRVGTTGDVLIEWQTLSFAYSAAVAGGVSVQHVTAACVAAAPTSMPINVTTAAPRASSFVLFSNRTPGTDNDAESFFTAQLTSDTNLRFSQAAASTTCTHTVDFAAQVVTWNGANVGRGIQAGGNATSFTAPTTLGGSPGFIVYSSRQATTDSGGNNTICRRRLRGEITSPLVLTFVRGCAGGSGDVQDISWEHVRTPTGVTVQQLTYSTLTGQPSVVIAFNPVDLTRSVLFMGGQGQGGSASGKTDYTATARVGAALARGVMTSGIAGTFTRSSSDLVGEFTGYVMQVTP